MVGSQRFAGMVEVVVVNIGFAPVVVVFVGSFLTVLSCFCSGNRLDRSLKRIVNSKFNIRTAVSILYTIFPKFPKFGLHFLLYFHQQEYKLYLSCASDLFHL